MFYKTKYFFISFFLLILLCTAGCMRLAERLPEEKNGRLYGITEGSFRSRWWNYYERGMSFADGEFWKKAELDLREAINQREADQRRSRTYGRHFIDYLPHCELGAVLFKQGRINEAIDELERSLASVKSAKAEFYLDQARKALIDKEQREESSPEINIITPDKPLYLTNAFSIAIQGTAKDEKNFVRKITVGGKDFRIDVSGREIPFYMEVPINQGKNEIQITAVNLAGKISEKFVTVNADRMGPAISIDDNETLKVSETFRVYAFDDSGLAELIINGEKILLDNAPLEFQTEKKIQPSQPEENKIIITAKDIAGNITSVKIPVSEISEKDDLNSGSLLAENSQNIILSDVSKQLSAQSDYKRPFVKINLNKPESERSTYLDQTVIDGEISSHEKRMKLFINGKEILEVPRKVFHFSYLTEKLKEGQNIFEIMAISPSHYSDAVTVRINRKIPCVKKPESRLKLALNPFTRTMTRDIDISLSTGFEYRLENYMREHHPVRFSRVEEIASEKGDNNHEAMRKAAGKRGFHCIMVGNIEERKNSEGKISVIITAWIEDTENGKPIVKTKDVYGEDADKDNIDGKLKTLAEHLKIKMIDELPMVEGMVLERHKQESITVDLGEQEKIKEGMEFIVYEQGEPIPGFEEVMDQDAKELGEAKVRKVKPESSLAFLNNESKKDVIQPKHKVITR